MKGRSDCELHQIAVSECRRRTPFAERVERRLDETFAVALRQVKACGDANHLRDHCKRNGKPCVFLESSSRSALERTMTRIIGEWPTTPT